MRRKRRHVLLILDNCPAHTKDELINELSNTTVFYLPPNTTSFLQPCDAGIIKSLKAQYRCRFLQLLVDDLDAGKPSGDAGNIDVLQAIRFLKFGWDVVSEQTISNCWRHTNIRPVMNDTIEVIDTPREGYEEIQALNNISIDLRRFGRDAMNVEEFVNGAGQEITATEETSLEDIVNEYNGIIENDDSEDIVIPVITAMEAKGALQTLGHYWQQQGLLEFDKSLEKQRFRIRRLEDKGKHQSSLLEYFQSSGSNIGRENQS